MVKWIPKYIPKVHEKRAGEKVVNIDWNDSFNTLISQGNWNTEAIEDLINLGNLSVKRAVLSEDSLKLGGQSPSYYAARSKVLGTDEDTYRPGNPWMPTAPEHPSNKRYVDSVKTYMEKLFDEYTVKYASGITLLGVYDTYKEFIAAHPTGKKGDAYIAGGEIYTWDPLNNKWYNAGPVKGDKGDKGDTGFGLSKGGRKSSMLYKLSDLDYDIGFTPFNMEQVVLSDTSRKITVSGEEPLSSQDGDIWIKV